ncbi:MAG TPA: hypothetical protein VKB93_24520 [Thermoanaerobaculia bacterium]|nr:hypothetical protein [Thermoanaerobaculia bacterium]
MLLLAAAACKQAPPPATDTHGLAEEIHHKPELARQIIAQVVAEQHGVVMIAEELAKNEMASSTVVDELMKHPEIAKAIADRCEAARIAASVNDGDKK